MRRNSIRTRMTLAFSLSIVLLMLVCCGSLIGYARYAAVRDADRRLADAKLAILQDLADPEEQPTLTETIREHAEEWKANNLVALVVSAEGRIRLTSQPSALTWPRRVNDGWRVVSFPVGKETVVVGLRWRATENALRTQTLDLAGISLLVTLAAAGGAWLLVGKTLSPIGSLSRQAQAASVDSLHIHLNAASQDAEVVGLVATLNGLLERLAETAEVKGRFYAAASHELRTPLQALSGHLEVARSRPRSEEEYRAAIDEAYLQTRRLISLTQDLLFLNRLETAASLPPSESIDPAEFCERALTPLRPLIATRALRLQTMYAAETPISAPPLHVEMLVRNLIENAVKYATAGGIVRITTACLPDGAQLEIFNTFDSMLPRDTERLFEPFFRPDASRNAETGGNGLGLAICKAVAAANGWKLMLYREGEGVVARVSFPDKAGIRRVEPE